MTQKQKEQREKAGVRAMGFCAVCGKLLAEGQAQYAHRIGNTETHCKYCGDVIPSGHYCCNSCWKEFEE